MFPEKMKKQHNRQFKLTVLDKFRYLLNYMSLVCSNLENDFKSNLFILKEICICRCLFLKLIASERS